MLKAPSPAQRIGVERRTPDRAERGRATVRSNAWLASYPFGEPLVFFAKRDT